MTSLETPRLLLREITLADAPGILALDSDPRVLRYVPNRPIATLEEAAKIIHYIRQQYERNGIGRWAVVRLDTQEFIGWCGLKLVDDSEVNGRTNYHDIGYRLLPHHWDQGFSSEAAGATMRYGLEIMKLPEINATVRRENTASRNILEKVGLHLQEEFTEPDGNLWCWYGIRNAQGQ
ncbi:GNAT family N-acetyltransferase [Hymenobacter sp. 5516J-16]|uniref:GNAT family N-acetyltransferase n=1 Tax=Hymenobacter sp. 5516J-16 TaxID=2932253 RepID=UPI001FD46079|nr:GNAT family N-acetyltransferase [Hymenobacter sp. 5516J-16]UOQ76401.1 GNAT family N-acetyltransferase [Hymenobacter sp. 5516J-16]